MNKLIILFAVVAAVIAVPVRHSENESTAEILRHESDVHAEGYDFKYETSNGVTAEEKGSLHGDTLVAQGSFKYTAPDGTPIDLTYVADHNGFQPSGAHLPVGPEVPEYVLRSLEYIRTHTPDQKLF